MATCYSRWNWALFPLPLLHFMSSGWAMLKTIIGLFQESILKGFDYLIQYSLVNFLISFYPLLTKVNVDSAMIWRTLPNHHRWGMVHSSDLWHLSGFVAALYTHSVILNVPFSWIKKIFSSVKRMFRYFFPSNCCRRAAHWVQRISLSLGVNAWLMQQLYAPSFRL